LDCSPEWALEPKDAGEIYRTEQAMLKIEHRIKQTATLFLDKRVSDEDFEVPRFAVTVRMRVFG